MMAIYMRITLLHRSLLVAFVSLIFALPSVAVAQSKAIEKEAEDLAEAGKEKMEQARKMDNAAKPEERVRAYVVACRELQKSVDLVPHSWPLYNLARCYEKINDYLRARDKAKEVKSLWEKEPGPPKVNVDTLLKRLEAGIPTLTVRLAKSLKGVVGTIEIDGVSHPPPNPLARGEEDKWEIAQEANPTKHTVVIKSLIGKPIWPEDGQPYVVELKPGKNPAVIVPSLPTIEEGMRKFAALTKRFADARSAFREAQVEYACAEIAGVHRSFLALPEAIRDETAKSAIEADKRECELVPLPALAMVLECKALLARDAVPSDDTLRKIAAKLAAATELHEDALWLELLAKVYDRMHLPASADRTFERALKAGLASKDPDKGANAVARRAELDREVPRLVLVVDWPTADMTVTLQSVATKEKLDVASGSWNRELKVDPGAYVVQVSSKGKSYTKTVEAGIHTTKLVPIRPLEDPTPPFVPPRSGACACRTASAEDSAGLLLFAVALVLLGTRRHRTTCDRGERQGD
jgi:MYXO-CTERM domain-containing protein